MKALILTLLSLSWLSACSSKPMDTSCPSAPPCKQGKPILKAVEEVVLMGQNDLKIPARMDTGATFSSLDIKLAQRLGLNQKIREYIEVRTAEGVSRRPVYYVPFILKGKKRTVRFTLADRQHLDYLVLIGQNGLTGFLIDPGQPQ